MSAEPPAGNRWAASPARKTRPARYLSASSRPRRHPAVPATALSTSARAAVHQAIKATTRKNRNAEAANQLLLALLAHRRPDPVTELLDHLGVDRDAVRERLAPDDRRGR
ncbi:hypothetical protein [Sphaerisporangium dianthi]|uniref:Uncharacterized protein n=1 Tax=Sphaerisporangium dianthi TaxID=1436120 RepID=A0ABV9CKV5_9ACTN